MLIKPTRVCVCRCVPVCVCARSSGVRTCACVNMTRSAFVAVAGCNRLDNEHYYDNYFFLVPVIHPSLMFAVVTVPNLSWEKNLHKRNFGNTHILVVCVAAC